MASFGSAKHGIAFEDGLQTSVATTVGITIETGRVVLFATKTCPKCRISGQLLEKAGISFDKVYYEDDPEFARKYNLKQAPTLLYFAGDDVTEFTDVTGVKEFIKAFTV